MKTYEKVNEAKTELRLAKEKLKGREAKVYLEAVWETATWTNIMMDESCERDYVNVKHFNRISVDYYAENHNLLTEMHDAAAYHKTMDDSEDWPAWKAAAYKAA